MGMRLTALPVLFALGLLCGAFGCVTLGDDLRRADRLYRDARYEDAEAWTLALASEQPRMTSVERLHFEYLRGMCAFRLGRRDDARHFLLVAQQLVQQHPEGLAPLDRSLLERTLDAEIAGMTIRR